MDVYVRRTEQGHEHKQPSRQYPAAAFVFVTTSASDTVSDHGEDATNENQRFTDGTFLPGSKHQG